MRPKPRWKTIVELVLCVAGVFVGAALMAENADWPPRLPESLLFVLGFIVVCFYVDKVADKWEEL